MSGQWHVADLGLVRACLVTGYGALAEYLCGFFPVLYRAAAGLAAVSLPVPTQVPARTSADYAEPLGRPWQGDLPAADAGRELPSRERYASPARLWYTLRDLGQGRPSPGLLDGLDVTVVLAGYAGAGEPAGDPEPAVGHTAELWPHVRFDWAFNPDGNTRYLPRPACSRAAFTLDTAARLTDLGGTCRFVRWRRRGHLAPLLDHPLPAPWKDAR